MFPTRLEGTARVPVHGDSQQGWHGLKAATAQIQRGEPPGVPETQAWARPRRGHLPCPAAPFQGQTYVHVLFHVLKTLTQRSNWELRSIRAPVPCQAPSSSL